jgi:hypothetical protein
MYGLTAHRAPTPELRRCCGLITDLILRCGQGEEAALGRLFDVFYRLVRAAVGEQGSVEATEEQVIQTFVHLWRHAPSYDPTAQPPVAWVMHQVSTSLLAGQQQTSDVAVPA